MKKIIGKVLLLSILVCVFLSGCTSTTMIESRLKSLTASNDEEFENERFEKLVQAISEKDRNKIKEMFSINALQETKDIESGIDYLFDMVEGEIISWEGGVSSVGETAIYGGKIVEIRLFYTLETNQNTYRVFLLDYRKDTGEPDNVGYYALRIIEKYNDEIVFVAWQDMVIPGIYIPEE